MSWGLWVDEQLESILFDQTEEGCSLKLVVWLLEYRKKAIFSVSFGSHYIAFCFELQGSFLPAKMHKVITDADEWHFRGSPNTNLCSSSVWWQKGWLWFLSICLKWDFCNSGSASESIAFGISRVLACMRCWQTLMFWLNLLNLSAGINQHLTPRFMPW